MIAQLIPVDGSKPISISRDISLVGRKRGLCDVVVDHTSVSKVHAALARTDGLLFLRDLGSTNGTRVNGQRVTRGALLPGDELSIASVKFRIHLGPGDAGVAPSDATEAFSSAEARDSRATLSDDDLGGQHALVPADKTIESDSDVRLLMDSNEKF
jgi:pSer/pThr/pTyr-binding forkhead associated (FHA) protein